MKNINRNRQRRYLGVALCALSVIPSPLAAQSRPEQARQQLQGHLTPEIAKLPLGARLTPTTQLTLTVGLVIPNTADLIQLVSQISDPNSPLYRKYLTPEQFADRFGATPGDYQSVLDWAQSNNLTAATHRNRFVVTVTGAVADIESALNVHMHYRTRADGTQFYSPDVEPSIKLSVPVEHIGGLHDFFRPESASGSGSGGSYQGTDFRNAYAPDITLTGKGQSVGIFMFNQFAQSDIDGYATQTGQTFLPVKIIPAGSTLSPGAEGTLDVEAVLSVAPAAQVVGFVGTSSDPTAILTNMTDHTEIKQFSSSWFWANGTSTDTTLMQQLATNGQSFFQASGDNGAYAIGWLPTYTDGSLDCRQFPSITVVGGTVLNMSGSGKSYGTLETAWTNSAGGIITSVPIPGYQSKLISGLNGTSTTDRNQPDVSAQASDILIYYDGKAKDIGGTSLATPLWAGYMALVNELAANAGEDSVGFANPSLYSIASGSDYDTNFHDIVSGCNPDKSGKQYCAGTGYDLVTGLGSPQNTLIYTLSGAHPQVVSFNPDGGPAAGGTKVTIKGSGFGGLEKVNFGGVPATHVTVLSDTELTAESPVAPDSDATIEVVSPGGKATAAGPYAYYPEIDGVTPSTGPVDGGITVTVTGLALGNAASFEFGVSGGAIATKVKCSSTKCTMVAPAHALGQVDIIAITPWGYGNSPINSKDKFTYQAPSITSINPPVGPTTGGLSITINGTNLQAGKTTVSFGGTVVTANCAGSTTSCVLTSPSHTAGKVPVTVTVAGAASAPAKAEFQFVVFPTVTGIVKDTGAAGSTVTLSGTGFSTTPGQTTFLFSGLSAVPALGVSCTSTIRCTAVVPPQGMSTSSTVTVTVNGYTSLDSVDFTYTTPPFIPPCVGKCI